jgi:hypothetical protein
LRKYHNQGYYQIVAKRKDSPAAQLARMRANKLTPERRQEIARKAIKARWDRVRASGVGK